MQSGSKPSRRAPGSGKDARARRWRRRLLIPIGALAIVVLVAVVASGGGGSGGAPAAHAPRFVGGLVVRNAPPLPAPISGEAVAAMPGGPLIVGGLDATESSDLSAVTVGNTAYVLGGYDGNEPIASVLATTDDSRFTEVTQLPAPGRYLAVAALDGRIFACGGESASGSANDAIQEVDPKAGTARVVGHLPGGIYHASAVVLGRAIYVLGGETGGKATRQIWRFEPGQKKVVAAGHLPQPIAGRAATTVGSTAYLIDGTGASGTALPSAVKLEIRRQKVPEPRQQAGGEGQGESAAAEREWPFSGQLLIADRGNNRLLVVNAKKEIL